MGGGRGYVVLTIIILTFAMPMLPVEVFWCEIEIKQFESLFPAKLLLTSEAQIFLKSSLERKKFSQTLSICWKSEKSKTSADFSLRWCLSIHIFPHYIALRPKLWPLRCQRIRYTSKKKKNFNTKVFYTALQSILKISNSTDISY